VKIRDSFATISDDKTEYEMPSGGLEIIADDGRQLFSITLQNDGAIEISSGGGFCKHAGVMTESSPLIITARASNCIRIRRPVWEITKSNQ
jgi:hypothetical protein